VAITTPQPPGPGLPFAAPSVKTTIFSIAGPEDLSTMQRFELDAVRLRGIAAAPAQVSLVVLVVALEPLDMAVAFEGQHVCGDAIEEPAVVRDHRDAAGEAEQRFLEGAQRVDIEIV